MNLYEMFDKSEQLTLIDALRDFLPIAIKHLKLKSLPKIHLQKQVNTIHVASFGGYNDGEQAVTLVINNRQPADILRTLAHELVHWGQGQANKIDDGSWHDGSELENEANAVAGVIMRDFARQYPQYLSLPAVTVPNQLEEKRRKKKSKPRGYGGYYGYYYGGTNTDSSGDGGDGGGGGESVQEAEEKCPPATQDISLNLKNRQKAIDEYHYGPLNPNLPNDEYWQELADKWNTSDIASVKQNRCGNCGAFDVSEDMQSCIAKGIGSEPGSSAMDSVDAGQLGYCKFLKFKCASKRTCDAWIEGGPITEGKHCNVKNAVPELKAALVKRKEELNKSSDKEVYNKIDKIMTRIANTYDITGQELHDMWTKRYGEIPDTWIIENFADGKKPGRKGLAKRSGVNCKQSVSKLRNIAKNSSGERQRMAHWCANMKSGKK